MNGLVALIAGSKSESFRRQNAHLLNGKDSSGNSAPTPIVERDLCPRPLAESPAKKQHPARFFVRVTSFRRRLLDEDNLSEKYFVDCCRYAGLIPGDDPGQARIITTQQKVASKAEERTEITIEEMPELG